MNNLLIPTMLCSLLTLTSYGQVKQFDSSRADSSLKQNVNNHLIAKSHRVPTAEDTLNYFKNRMIEIRDPQTHREAMKQFQPLIDERNKINKTKNKK